MGISQSSDWPKSSKRVLEVVVIASFSISLCRNQYGKNPSYIAVSDLPIPFPNVSVFCSLSLSDSLSVFHYIRTGSEEFGTVDL